jgi:hypothetical protein
MVRDVLFIRPTKVAGTSIMKTLKLQQLTCREFPFKQRGKRWITFVHIDYPRLVREGLVSREFDESSYKFAFVRNPYDRAVSVWSHRWTELSFEEFCRRINKNIEDIGLINSHSNSGCNPQARWLHGVKLNFLGKFESLLDDYGRLCEEIGHPNKGLLGYNIGDHEPYESYYTNETIDLIRKVYAEDFFWFGYDT